MTPRDGGDGQSNSAFVNRLTGDLRSSCKALAMYEYSMSNGIHQGEKMGPLLYLLGERPSTHGLRFWGGGLLPAFIIARNLSVRASS